MNRFRTALRRVDPYLVLLILLSLLALTPLAAPGYFYGAHDGRHSIFYVEMFDQAIRDGALWPRWAMHHAQGYGYPTFVIQAPLAFYVAEIFVLLGFGLTHAVKIAWALGFLAGGWGMYALVRYALRMTRYASPAALVAALLYVFIPYHLLDMYVRAAFAETMMMAWFPWTFLAFDRLIARGTAPGWQGRLLVAAVSFAAVLLTHVFALIAFTPLLVAFVLFRLGGLRQRDGETEDGGRKTEDGGRKTGDGGRRTEDSRITHHALRITFLSAAAGLAALLLSLVFILPLLAEGPLLDQEVYTRAAYDYTRNWVYFGQFFNPFWGYGFSDDPYGVNDGMGFQIGVVAVLLAMAAVYLLLSENRPSTQPEERTAHRSLMAFLWLASAAVLFTVTPASAPLWRAIPWVAVIQFPWRLLALSSFTLSALGGLVVLALLPRTSAPGGKGPIDSAGALVVALLVVYASYSYARPQQLQPVEPWREDGRAVAQFEEQHPDMIPYTAQVEERFTTSPMTEVYRNYEGDFSLEALPRLGILKGEGQVLRNYSRGRSFGGEVEMATPGVVQIRLYHYPGWQVKLDGQPVPVRLSPPEGLMEIDVPSGRHRIDVRMGTTPVRTAGAAVSGITFLALLGLWIFSERAKK